MFSTNAVPYSSPSSRRLNCLRDSAFVKSQKNAVPNNGTTIAKAVLTIFCSLAFACFIFLAFRILWSQRVRLVNHRSSWNLLSRLFFVALLLAHSSG